MRRYWYYATVWPICGWGSRTLHVWAVPREVPGVGRVYGTLAYDDPLPAERCQQYGLVPAPVGEDAVECTGEREDTLVAVGV